MKPKPTFLRPGPARLAPALLALPLLVLAVSFAQAAPGETRVPPDPLVLVGVAPGILSGPPGTGIAGLVAVRGRYSSQVRLLDATTGEARRTVLLPPEVRLDVPPALSADGRWLAVVLTPDPLTQAGRVGILSTFATTTPGFQKLLVAGGLSGTLNLAFSPDGSRLAAGNRGGYAQLWDWAGARRVTTVTSESRYEPGRLEFSPDSRLFAPIFRAQTRTRIYDAVSGELRVTLGGVGYGSFTPDSGGLLASRGRLITLPGGREAPTPPYLLGSSGVIGFSTDGSRVLVRRSGVDAQGREWLELREVATGRTLGALTRVWDGGPEALSPDGTTLIGGDGEGGIRLLPLAPR